MTKKEVTDLIEKKKTAFKGLLNDSVAVSMVADDLKIKLNGETPKIASQDVDTVKGERKPVENFEIVVKDTKANFQIAQTHYPSEDEILFVINRHKFIKEKLLDADDTMLIQGRKFVKKSGWRKFINAFGISIEILFEKVYEKDGDIVAEYRVKAIAPNGQFVIGDGTKSKSEYWSEKFKNHGSYTLHNLKATARTRAINIAVSDLVGYGAKSAEEFTPSEIEDDESIPEKTFYFDEQ